VCRSKKVLKFREEKKVRKQSSRGEGKGLGNFRKKPQRRRSRGKTDRETLTQKFFVRREGAPRGKASGKWLSKQDVEALLRKGVLVAGRVDEVPQKKKKKKKKKKKTKTKKKAHLAAFQV